MIDESIKFSIVIAAYNNTKTINRCLDSIYNQTYTNYEVILSDDCSPDVDYSYLKEKYENLKILRLPENKGAGPARQYGIDNGVTGDWLLFVDQDDELSNHLVLLSLSRTIRRHNGSVLIQGDYKYISINENNSGVTKIDHPDIRPLHGIAFNVHFLKENRIGFHPNLGNHEDVYFNLLFRYHVKHKLGDKAIVRIPTILYTQYRTDDSVTQKKYNGLNFFEGTFNYQVDLYSYLLDDTWYITSDADKIELMKHPLMNALSIYESVVEKNDKSNYEFIINFGKDMTRLIDKINMKFSIKTKEEFYSIFFNQETIKTKNVLNLSSSQMELDVRFDRIYSIYQYYKDGMPYSHDSVNAKLLSIVIPVYNSKNIIRDTLDKLYKIIDVLRCEVIIVNDASPDGDYDYLKECYDSIVIINNETNKGYATSRQTGIDIATGKWLIFLDHDDEILDNIMCELDIIEKTQIPYLILRYGYKTHVIDTGEISGTQNSEDMFHGNIYNLNYIKKNNIRFTSQIKASEDTYFNHIIYDRVFNTYQFLIKSSPHTSIYQWNRYKETQSNCTVNGRTWSEDHYGDYINSRLLSLSFNDDVIPIRYKIYELYNILFDAIRYADEWSINSNNFRKEIYNDIQLVIAEIYKHLDDRCNNETLSNFVKYLSTPHPSNIEEISDIFKINLIALEGYIDFIKNRSSVIIDINTFLIKILVEFQKYINEQGDENE